MTMLSADTATKIIATILPEPKYGSPEYKARNEDHAKNPRLGDYWHDQFSPAYVVLALEPLHVVVCSRTKDVGDNQWTWDLSKHERMTYPEFEGHLAYQSIPGYWADCVPSRMRWAAEEYAELSNAAAPAAT